MSTTINVLFIEDNPGDARLVREEFRSINSKIRIQLEWVDRLERGLQRLEANNITAVLLDLNLPKVSGYEVLEHAESPPDMAAHPACDPDGIS